MVSRAAMTGRLPSLYRPEAGDTTLLTALLAGLGAVLDAVQDDAGVVMHAHWLDYADAALFSPFVARARDLADQPRLDPFQVDDADTPDGQFADTFPYVNDLARLAALLPVLHWNEPAHLREGVEAYRTRIRRTVEIYKNGLGTLSAIRRMVEAQLPLDMTLPPPERDRPFWLEEFAALDTTLFAVPTPGPPDGILGPLMGWEVDNRGLRPVAPTVYIRAETEAVRPMLEERAAGVGLAYSGTLAAGEALRLRPTFTSWLFGADGLLSATDLVDPTAPGPWSGAPTGAMTALHQTPDQTLWAALGTELWRFDGRIWAMALDGLPAIRCLAGDGAQLLVGTANGLHRVALYPAAGDPFTATPVAALASRAVNALARDASGGWWVATDSGVGTLAGDSFTPTLLQGTEIAAIYADGPDATFFGGTLGLFLHQAQGDRWHVYHGTQRTEQAGDWQPFSGALPSATDVALPPVLAIWRDGEGALWLGTANGLARYRGYTVTGLTYETILEAFPDLGVGPVTAVRPDPRGLLWLATDRGLLRFDGRQLWQHRADGGWVQLGHADLVYLSQGRPKARGAWRFDRAAAAWVQFDTSQFTFDPAEALRTTAEPAVAGFTWTDGILADTGTWDGATFTAAAAVDAALLQTRVKPDKLRIVAGGIPALPRLVPGLSAWRYLAREPDDGSGLPNPPAWTTEARLLPPPDVDEAITGRFEELIAPPDSRYDAAVFAYPPVARVWFEFQPEGAPGVRVRLKRRAPGETLDPAIIERVRQGVQQVRPAGVRVVLAVDEEVVS
jgi:hypothetical protein